MRLALALALAPALSALAQDCSDFRIGNALHLAPCDEDNQCQHYYVTSSTEDQPGQIWWSSQNIHVAMFPAGNTGWPAQLFLSQTIDGNPFERWTEANRSAGVTGIDNDFEDGNLCWRWAVVNATIAPGAPVRVQLCSAANAAAQFKCDSPGPGLIEAYYENGTGSGLCVVPDAAISPSISLDDGSGSNVGAEYSGTGVIMGEGSARLLLDYDEAVVDLILDLLFAPGYLASLDFIKIEIGGDGAAVMGSTPSHQHAAAEAPVFTRGSQAWLAQQARIRSPSLAVVALPWSFPGWLVSNGSPFGDCPGGGPCAAAAYVAQWVAGVNAAYSDGGSLVDFVGVLSDHWDASSADYVKALRARLDAAGLGAVGIVCGEDGTWACAALAAADADLLAAVAVFSSHGDAGPGALAASLGGRRLWRTHQSSLGEAANLRGAAVMGVRLNVDAAVYSSVMVWGAVCAQYDGTPEHNNGLVRADSPTTGFFAVTPTLFAVAHTSRFARPGWRTLDPAKMPNGGTLARGGSYVVRYLDGGSQWSIVICKFATGGNDQQNAWAIAAEYATFQLAGILYPQQTQTAYVWATSYSAVSNTNASFMVNTQNVSVISGHFSVWLDLNTHVTITNVPRAPLPVLAPPAMPAAFPAAFSSDSAWAAATAPGQSPPFLVDINGAFETALDGTTGLVGARQMASAAPFTRFGTDTAPHAILGSQQWADVDVRAEVLLPAGDGALLGVRCSSLTDTTNSGVTGADRMPGIWLNVSAAGWALVNSLDGARSELAAGGAGAVAEGAWSPLRIVVRGARVVASAGEVLLASVNLSAAPFTPRAGFVGLGAAAFGARPTFRSVVVAASGTACGAPPAPNASLFVEACDAGSAGQNFTVLRTGRSAQTAQLAVAGGLCVQADSSNAPDYRFKRARRVYLAVCDAESDAQQFRLEMVDASQPAPVDANGLSFGPIQGIDGVCLGSVGNSDSDDSEIIGFPWQASSTAIWSFDGAVGGTGAFMNTYGGFCLSACAPI